MLIVQCLECKSLQNQHFKINNLKKNLINNHSIHNLQWGLLPLNTQTCMSLELNNPIVVITT